ncbi:putative uncharacterized protein PRO2829, partial [Nomascus leucogenys]
VPVVLATWETKVRGSPEPRSLRPTWTTWRNPSRAWWLAPIVPATREAEA